MQGIKLPAPRLPGFHTKGVSARCFGHGGSIPLRRRCTSAAQLLECPSAAIATLPREGPATAPAQLTTLAAAAVHVALLSEVQHHQSQHAPPTVPAARQHLPRGRRPRTPARPPGPARRWRPAPARTSGTAMARSGERRIPPARKSAGKCHQEAHILRRAAEVLTLHSQACTPCLRPGVGLWREVPSA